MVTMRSVRRCVVGSGKLGVVRGSGMAGTIASFPVGPTPGTHYHPPGRPDSQGAAMSTTFDSSTCKKAGVSAMAPVEPVETFWSSESVELILRFRRGVENFDRRMFNLNEEQVDTAFLPEADCGRWPVRVLIGHIADADLV